MNELPKRFEPFGHRELERDFDKGPPLDRLRAHATLTDLAVEYALFTHVPLVLAGGMRVDLVREYLNQLGLEAGVCRLPLPAPVFDLGVLPFADLWACNLFACDRAIWDGLSYHLGTAAMINRGHQYFARVVTQDVPVADVVALLRTSVVTLPCPSVMVTTFSVDSNRGVLAFEPAAAMPVDRPRLVSKPPLPETVALARAELAGARRPYDAANKLMREV